MKKRKLVEKIVREGCENVDCHGCPFVGHDGACSLPGDTAVAFAIQWLSEHPKKDELCPRCGGSGGEIAAGVVIACLLCLGTGKRIKRSDLEAEVVRLREGKPL